MSTYPKKITSEKYQFSLESVDGMSKMNFSDTLEIELLEDGRVRAYCFDRVIGGKQYGFEGFGDSTVTAVLDFLAHRCGETDRPMIARE